MKSFLLCITGATGFFSTAFYLEARMIPESRKCIQTSIPRVGWLSLSSHARTSMSIGSNQWIVNWLLIPGKRLVKAYALVVYFMFSRLRWDLGLFWYWCILHCDRTHWSTSSRLCLSDFTVMELKLAVTRLPNQLSMNPIRKFIATIDPSSNKSIAGISGLQHFELYSMVSLLGSGSSPKDSRFLPLGCIREASCASSGRQWCQQISVKKPRICVRSTVFTDNKCHETILEWISWSFSAMCNMLAFWKCIKFSPSWSSRPTCAYIKSYSTNLWIKTSNYITLCGILLLFSILWWSPVGSGVWPSSDPWGQSFSDTYMPQWHRRAGHDLAGGWRGAFDGCQADQEWLHRVFKLQRSSDEIEININQQTCSCSFLTFLVGEGYSVYLFIRTKISTKAMKHVH